jgi:hypothetical protein
VDNQKPIIRASEISQYAFCTRAWWLGRVKGYQTINVSAMRRGTTHHEAHGRDVEGYLLLRRLAVALIVLAGVLLILWLLLGVGG